MAFGLPTAKWRMFRRNLDVKDLECATAICRAAAKLHNCVLENDGSTATPGKAAPCEGDFVVKSLPNNDKGHTNALPANATQGMVGKDQQRASVLAGIETMQLQRLIDSIPRDCNEELDDRSNVDDSWTVNCCL